ncbi:putative histone deacetylase [Phaeosphaeria sp. MPI-PUGE-AT-0046c]|nr:putative histone deacetylase [Phaeosphaeria sp. MPI-PUGE-AT-0046c]
MDTEDFPMADEDSILASTELNGQALPVTVDPSKLGLQGSSHFRNEPLPFHSPSKASTLMQPKARLSMAKATPPSDDEDDDDMDMSPPPPRRRASPEVRIAPRPRAAVLPYASSKTGLVYDSRMRFHAELPSMSLNANDIHPEDPRRIHSIFEEIRQAGLVGSSVASQNDQTEEHCWRIAIRAATKPEILLIHSRDHYDFVESLQAMSAEELKFHSERLDSIYFNHSTYECAKLAAGGAIEACKAVVQGAVRNAIAIIRPPGHHAESDQPSGFCIFNNVPIATRVCQNAYPESCRKVLILDWDVHHGNGIQHAFYDDPNVLYISLHVFLNGNFYPNLPDGDLDYCGEGAGEGKNVNIPWAETGMGDAEYIYAFQEVVMPIATEFDPDLVIISAGFDAAEGDLLGGCFVTPACYGHMTHMLMRLAKGKLVVCLEGGYNLRSIARSALAVTRVLMLEPPDRLEQDLPAPKDSAVHIIEQIKRQHSKYWKCLYPKHLDRSDPGYQDTLRMHEIIREWQSLRLSQEHAMTPLQINKAGLAQTFEHNVIASPEIMGRFPHLVIFHDPPSFRDNPDPVTGKRELHNTWLTDVTKRYIDWAIDNGFQVIDINIPRIVAVEDPEEGYVKSDNSTTRALQTRDMANYIWENYLEACDATQIFLMGIGDAYLGLVDLLSNNDNCTEGESAVDCLIGFVAETTIQSIKRATDDTIQHWYHAHSRIFVKSSHYVWDPSRQRKLRRKLGNLIKSPQDSLDSMLEEHLSDVQNLLLEKKAEYEERSEASSRADEGALRSPPIIGGGGNGGGNLLRSPKGPALGYFSVSSPVPKSPRSPMRRV